MGLAVKVGMYADLIKRDHAHQIEVFANILKGINEVLKEEGFKKFNEPKKLKALHMRVGCDSLPYSYIHYLRRFYAHILSDADWIPEPVDDDKSPTEDPIFEEQSLNFDSHLICHSDAEGFYLPIELDEVLFDLEDKGRIIGGMLGSSYSLLDELLKIAPKLGITLIDNKLSDEEAEKINKLAQTEEGFYREYHTWIILFEAARLSIEYKTAIIFT